MRYLLIFLVCLVPSVAIADCPESENFSFQSLTSSGFGITAPSMYYQLQVNITGVGASYLAIGYVSGNFVHNGDETIFNKIPKAEFDDDPYLRGFYRGYVSGELITDINAAYNQPSTNGTIDLLSYEGDDFLACEEPPSGPAGSIDDLVPWLITIVTLLFVIAIATTFISAASIWDLLLRAKNNPTWWGLLFCVVLPSVASAQGSICNKVPIYSDYYTNVYQGGTNNSFTLRVNFTDGSYQSFTISSTQYGSQILTGNPPFSGIPYDVMMSDSFIRNIWNGFQQGLLHIDLQNAANSGTAFTYGTYSDVYFPHCGCTDDPSFGGCPNYQPSGPDQPTYCSDGETEDENPENPFCGCPGQDYQICDDEECEDSDGDLCCDSEDPEPDNPDCGCNRTGPMGDCEKQCPECEKSFQDYMDQVNDLLQDHNLDLSQFLGRGTTNGMVIPLNLQVPYPISQTFNFQIPTDERPLDEGVLKQAIGFARSVIRMAALFFVMIYFIKNFLWILYR